MKLARRRMCGYSSSARSCCCRNVRRKSAFGVQFHHYQGPSFGKRLFFCCRRAIKREERSKYRDIIKYNKDYFTVFGMAGVIRYVMSGLLFIYLFEFVIKKNRLQHIFFLAMIYVVIFNLK